MAEFEDILARVVSESDDRQALLNIAGKYPALKSAVMAQDDYSRKMNEHQQDLSELEKWRRWKQGGVDPATGQLQEAAWDETLGSTKAEALTRQQLEAANQRILELEATGGDVNFDQVMTELGKKGFMTEQQFKEKIAPTIVDRKTFDEELIKRINYSNAVVEDVAGATFDLVQDHSRNFPGETLKARELWKFMADNKLGTDVDAAYRKMYEPRLNELKQKTDQEREAAIRKEEREKTLLETAQANGGRGNPVDNNGGTRQYGHLEARKIETAKAADDKPGLEGAALGQNTIASIAAEEFRKNPAAFQKVP